MSKIELCKDVAWALGFVVFTALQTTKNGKKQVTYGLWFTHFTGEQLCLPFKTWPEFTSVVNKALLSREPVNQTIAR